MANKKFETLDGINSTGDVTISGDLSVNTDVLFVDASTNRVGINKSTPTSALDVSGTITATTFSGNGASLTSVDAATVDSIEGASLLRSDTSDSFSGGNLTFTSASLVIGSSANAVIQTGRPMRFGNTNTPSATLQMNSTSNTTGNFEISTSGVNVIVQDDLIVNGDVISLSDEREKENIEQIGDSLKLISEINGVYYNLKANPDRRNVGLIAQEVEKVLPEAVYDRNGRKNIAYGNIIGLLVEAIKELQDKVEKLSDGV